MAVQRNAGRADANDHPMWGDGPADTFDRAIDLISAEFEQALGRRPTLAELRAGLEFSLTDEAD
jgi:hypothetical protein